jgi:hypothetical protein
LSAASSPELVRSATFVDGTLVERPEDVAAEAAQPEAIEKVLIHRY